MKLWRAYVDRRTAVVCSGQVRERHRPRARMRQQDALGRPSVDFPGISFTPYNEHDTAPILDHIIGSTSPFHVIPLIGLFPLHFCI